MKLTVLENDGGKLVLEIKGENHTFLNLLRDTAWGAGSRQSSYMIEHPYLSEPKLIIRADNPKKVLDSSAQTIIDSAKEFEKEFRRASTK